MRKKNLHYYLTLCIASVWLINGLYCKVLGFVPRHEEIVARILGLAHAHIFTILIGISEIIMFVWIISRYQQKLNAIAQIIIVATMNTIEFLMASDLLLWGKLNAVFAFLFISLVYFNTFHLNKQ
jgi:hypothetical protein